MAPGTEVVLEIVYQAPVLRLWQGLGVFGDKLANNGRFTGALNPGDKDIIAGAFHVQPEFNGLDRSFLTDDFIQRFDLGRVFEVKNFRIANRSQIGGFQFIFFRHLLVPDRLIFDFTVLEPYL